MRRGAFGALISRWSAIAEAPKYPGAQTSPQQVYALAEEYRAGAHALKERGQRRQPLSWAPCRLCAIQAIELYLNAMLLRHGKNPGEIRALQHNLQERVALAVKCGINLRARTLKHIRSLDQNREYVVTRYAPEMLPTVSQINRLMATLDEVARKVSQILMVDTPKAVESSRSR